MKIDLILFFYECEKCKKTFEFPCLKPESYGDFLLFDAHGNMAYLDALSDPIFREVQSIFKYFLSKDELEKLDFRHNLFAPSLSAACDLSPSSMPYEDRMPPCPTCHQSDFIEFGPIDPPKFVDLDIPNATHHVWNKLSDIEKKELIQTIITQTKIETRQALINEVKLFIVDLDKQHPPKKSFEMKLRDKLNNYLLEIEKPHNEHDIKAADRKLGDYWFDSMEKMHMDWYHPLIRRCSKITDLHLKNGF